MIKLINAITIILNATSAMICGVIVGVILPYVLYFLCDYYICK